MASHCRRCIAEGIRPESFGNDRKCAFPGADFRSDNWNCATMNALRDLVDGEDFVLLSWYKRRGRTETAAVVRGEGVVAKLTLPFVERLLGAYAK